MRKIFAAAVVAAVAALGGWWLLAPEKGFGAIDGYVFVADSTAPQASVIDAVSDALVGSVALPFVADHLLVSRALMRLLVLNRAEGVLAVVDLASGAVEHRIALGIAPDRMVLSPDGLRLAAPDVAAGKVALVNIADLSLTAVIEGMHRPEALTFSADGTELYLADNAQAAVVRIKVASGEMLAPLDLAGAGVVPGAAALSALTRTPDGRMGFVTDAVGGKGYVIDLRDWQITKVIGLGNAPSRAYGTADGQFLLVANTGSRTISVIATDRFAVVATLPGVGDVTSIATGFFETLAYVVSAGERRAVVVDLETLTVAGEVALDGVPGQAVADVDGKKLYVPLGGVGKVALIDVFNKRIGDLIIGTPAAPGAPAMAASNNYCH